MEKQFVCRPASETDLSRIWQKNIENNPDEPNWVRWRDEFIGYNRDGAARTFVVCADDEPVGEVTLMYSTAWLFLLTAKRRIPVFPSSVLKVYS